MSEKWEWICVSSILLAFASELIGMIFHFIHMDLAAQICIIVAIVSIAIAKIGEKHFNNEEKVKGGKEDEKINKGTEELIRKHSRRSRLCKEV